MNSKFLRPVVQMQQNENYSDYKQDPRSEKSYHLPWRNQRKLILKLSTTFYSVIWLSGSGNLRVLSNFA